MSLHDILAIFFWWTVIGGSQTIGEMVDYAAWAKELDAEYTIDGGLGQRKNWMKWLILI